MSTHRQIKSKLIIKNKKNKKSKKIKNQLQKRKIEKQKEVKKYTLETSSFPTSIPKEVIDEYKKYIESIMKQYPRNKSKREKKVRGEPLKYKQKYCIKLIEMMAEGKDKTTIGAEMGITYSNLVLWEKKYPEFGEAMRIGKQLSARWWLEVGRINLNNRGFNSTLWVMNMNNRLKWLNIRKQQNNNFKFTKENIVEFKIDDERIARIINIAKNNETIVDSGKFIENQQEVYTDNPN